MEKTKTKKINNEKESNSAFHFFLYLVSFLSLFFVSSGVGAIIFQIINKNFPEVIGYETMESFDQVAIKYGIAALLVGVPVYFYLMHLIGKNIFKGKIVESSGVRKWLTYIVLFFASATIIGDLITLIFNVLDGEIVARFILKVLTILIIAGVIFVYYLMSMRREKMKGKKYISDYVFAYVSLIVIIVSFVFSFFIVDSPTVSRDKKFDRQTEYDLSMVNDQIKNYYTENKILPISLGNIEKDLYPIVKNKSANITYSQKGIFFYELCADFKRDSSEYKQVMETYYSENWNHKAGNTCFQKEIEKGLRNNPTLKKEN